MRELIASSSSSSALVEGGAEAPPAGQLSRSQKGVRKGAWLMLASLALALVIAFLSAIDDDFAVFLLLPLLCFIVGFGRVLYSAFMSGKITLVVTEAPAQPNVVSLMPGQTGTAASRRELSPPPPQVAPIESFTARRAETAEMVQPPSVTENTTRLLDEEADAQRG